MVNKTVFLEMQVGESKRKEREVLIFLKIKFWGHMTKGGVGRCWKDSEVQVVDHKECPEPLIVPILSSLSRDALVPRQSK